MKIGINGNEANIENRVGVNTYAYKIISELYKLQDSNILKHEFTIYLSQKPLPDMPRERKGWKYEIFQGATPWTIRKLMPRMIFGRDKPDVLFTPSHYAPPIAGVPQVISIMDLGYLNFSEQFEKKVFWQLKYWSAISIFVSKRVIAISQATKKDIVRHYPFASRKIKVTLLGYDQERFNSNVQKSDVRRIKDGYSIGGDYILFLSTLKPSKNLEGIVKAFSVVRRKRDIKLVIAGKKGWMYEGIFGIVKEKGLENDIVFTDFIDEKDKKPLLQGAKVFVSPSFWEGFGLHVLEAMACGTPVIVSNRGSLPEIVGEEGVVVDPENVESIANGISKLLEMPESSYNRLVARGIKRAKTFSWQKTAKKTLEIVEKAVK